MTASSTPPSPTEPAVPTEAAAPASSRPSPAHYRDLLRSHLDGIQSTAINTPLSECAGAILAEPLLAPVDLPLFLNSQMDGYAVRSAEISAASAENPVTLPVARIVAAGDPPGPGIEPGQAVKIMTGAAVPAGADCVVPVEDTHATKSASGALAVSIRKSRAAGEFLRHPGDDVRRGQQVIPAGTRLRAHHIAAAASLGVPALMARRRPRIAVIATGSELVPPGESLAAGQIWESNSLALSAAATEAGWTINLSRTCSDNEQEFVALLDSCRDADLILTAGAVSMGDFEVVRQTLSSGPGAWFGHIGMQPGGPQGMANWDGVPVVCLPGNPVSALVSFVVLLRPILRELAGLDALATRAGRLHSPVRSPAGKVQYLRGHMVDGADVVEPVSGPGSHLVAAMAAAECLIEIPAEATWLDVGAEVGVIPL